MSVIHEERLAQGITQAELARRLGVSKPAVSQWEKAEDDGTITVKTLRKALAALGRQVAILPVSNSPLRHAAWGNRHMCSTVEPDPAGSHQAILNARFGDRQAIIAGECLASGLPLTPDQLWLITDRTSVDTPLYFYNEARDIRDSYDQLLRRIAAGRPGLVLRLPDGRRVTPSAPPATLESALQWGFDAIANGARWLDALRATSSVTVRLGYPWPMLPPRASFFPQWDDAVGTLASIHRADKLAALVIRAMRRELR